jgi:hypothetical protein
LVIRGCSFMVWGVSYTVKLELHSRAKRGNYLLLQVHVHLL